jgi:hypothetical protein
MVDEEASVEAYRLTITYGFESDGSEFVVIHTDDDISNVLILGMLEIAKNRVLNPELYERDEEE